MLSADDLSAMRATQAATFDLTGVFKRMTLVSDGAGGQIETPSTVATTPVRVAVNNALGGEIVVAGKLTSDQTFLVTAPYGTAVKNTDWVEVSDGQVYDIINVKAPHSRETAVVCLCTRRAT